MNLCEMILSNPEGGTVGLDGDPLPKTGFFVGGAGTVLIFRDRTEINQELIMAWSREHQSGYIGWWTDSETSKVYVDWSSWYSSRSQAAYWAARRGEIAYWNIGTGESEKVGE